MSGFSTTPNFGLKKPSTGADDGLWGTHWNQNADALDALIKTVQDGSPLPSSTTPIMDGTAAIGVGTTWARSDHIHPTDTSRYAASNPSGYQTAAQVQAAVAPAFNGTGRNLIHNPLFNVAQRGAGPFTTSGYTADRWAFGFTGGSVAVYPQSAVDAVRSAIGDEAAEHQLGVVVTGTSGAADYAQLYQNIEGVRRLAGKTITVSFWAVAASGTPKIGVNIYQSFGFGGSPSAGTQGTGQSVTISTTWARYSVTLVVPSVVGKTLGTAADNTQLDFWFSAGSGYAGASGSVGVQSNTFTLWGVQLEVGSVATPLEKPDPRYDLSNCQRFYQIAHVLLWVNNQVATGQVGASTAFATAMRATPTLVLVNNASTNVTGLAASGNPTSCAASGNTTANGTIIIITDFLASADL